LIELMISYHQLRWRPACAHPEGADLVV